jgi:ketosteroid isomerase-like protein
MKKLLLFAPLLVSLVVLGQPGPTVTAPPSTATPEVTAAITQLRDGLVDSFNKSDLNRLLTYLDPEVIATWQNGEVTRGQEGVRAYYEKMMSGDGRVVREVTLAPEVLGRQFHGDWVVSWGTLHDQFTLMDGGVLPLDSHFTIVMARRGDRWLVTAYHASVNAFDNPVLALAVGKTGRWVGVGAGLFGVLAGFLLARLAGRKRVAA